ncbi:TPR repeat region-containing protein [Nocardia blacklockiae]|uniref:TPR repeat region-containing protein n=1 Tax=Nocardia blacklockiae TaxID=480036 RepID=UPI0018932C1A|nr:hypothetical protein [Nocardia blacklockiae]MBF6172725.1 hypothetical protein [Nocardia blacklockiae]
MAATRSQAEQCDPNALDALVKEWQTAHDTVTTGLDKTGSEYTQSQSYWTGKTGDRARDTTQQAVTAGRTFTGELQTAITTLTADRDAIWRAKNSATQAITNALNAKYEVAEDGTVEPSEAAKIAAQSSSQDKNDQTAALAALWKYGTDTLQPPIKTALNDLGTAVEAATGHIQNAFQNSAAVSTVAVEAPAKLDPNKLLTAEQGKEDGATIADGKLSDQERQRILDHLKATGLSPEQLTALREGRDVTIPQSSMDYLTNLYDKSGRDGLLTLSETLKSDGSAQSKELRQYLANGMMTLSNENLVSRDPQGKVRDRGGFDKLNPEIREIVGTRPNIAGAPDSNTRQLPDDYRSGLFGPKTDHRSGILDYEADLAKFSDFVSNSGQDYQPGDRFGVEMGRQAAHQAWILDHHGIGDYMGTKYPDHEAIQDAQSSAQNLLGVAARNHDSDYALLTGNGSDELFGKDTPGQSWHPYNHETTVGALLTHEWNDDGAALGSMVAWTADDAHSPDTTKAEHAGQAAGALAELMSNTKTGNGTNMYESMLNMPGQDGRSFAEINPRAAQGIATSLVPYVGDMVEAPSTLSGTRGFPEGSIGPVEATRIFSILDGDPKAGSWMNGAAMALAEKADHQFADSATTPGKHADLGLGTASGRLYGLVDAGIAAHVADLNLHDTEQAKATSDQRAAAYGVAQNLIGISGLAGPVGGVGGPIAQAVSEWYKAPLTGVDPDYSGRTPNAAITDTAFDLTRSGSVAGHSYNMLSHLINSGQVSRYMLPSDVQNVMFDTTEDGNFTVKPYTSAADNSEHAHLLETNLPDLLEKYGGIRRNDLSDYTTYSTQAHTWYNDKLITTGTIDGQWDLKRLKTDELEKNGYNKWVAGQ